MTIPQLAHLGYALSYGVGYKGTVHRAFSEQPKGCVRRYAVRGGGSAGVDHGRLGGVLDVRAGASLDVRRHL